MLTQGAPHSTNTYSARKAIGGLGSLAWNHSVWERPACERFSVETTISCRALFGVGLILAKALGKLAPVQAKVVAAGPNAIGNAYGAPAFGPTTYEHRGLGDYTPQGWGGSNDPTIVEHRYIDERSPYSAGAAAVAEVEEESKESTEAREARETAEVMRALGIDNEDEAIDFEAIDNAPVDLVFLLLTPSEAGADHLKALARVSRLLRNATLCEKLRAADDSAAIFALLTENDVGTQAA